jgi:hypothetical protein
MTMEEGWVAVAVAGMGKKVEIKDVEIFVSCYV